MHPDMHPERPPGQPGQQRGGEDRGRGGGEQHEQHRLAARRVGQGPTQGREFPQKAARRDHMRLALKMHRHVDLAELGLHHADRVEPPAQLAEMLRLGENTNHLAGKGPGDGLDRGGVASGVGEPPPRHLDAYDQSASAPMRSNRRRIVVGAA